MDPEYLSNINKKLDGECLPDVDVSEDCCCDEVVLRCPFVVVVVASCDDFNALRAFGDVVFLIVGLLEKQPENKLCNSDLEYDKIAQVAHSNVCHDMALGPGN